jgi:hypothetical protein
MHVPASHRPYLCVYPTVAEQKILDSEPTTDEAKLVKVQLEQKLKYKATVDCYKWRLYKPKPVRTSQGESYESRTRMLWSPDKTRISFFPDVPNEDYVLRLAVTDGCATVYKSLTMRAKCNCRPVPNAGKPMTITSIKGWYNPLERKYIDWTDDGKAMYNVLDASMTTDDDIYPVIAEQEKKGDVLSYQWEVVSWDPATPEDAASSRVFAEWKKSLAVSARGSNNNVEIEYSWRPVEQVPRVSILEDSVKNETRDNGAFHFESRGFYRPVTECRRWDGTKFSLITPTAGTPYTGEYYPDPYGVRERILPDGTGDPNSPVRQVPALTTTNYQDGSVANVSAFDQVKPVLRNATNDLEVSYQNGTWFSTPYLPVPGMAYSIKDGRYYHYDNKGALQSSKYKPMRHPVPSQTRGTVQSNGVLPGKVFTFPTGFLRRNYVDTLVGGGGQIESSAAVDKHLGTRFYGPDPESTTDDEVDAELGNNCPTPPCRYYYMGPDPVDARGYEIAPGGVHFGSTTSAAPYIIFSYAYQETVASKVQQTVSRQSQTVCSLNLKNAKSVRAGFTMDNFKKCRGTFCFRVQVSDGCNGKFTDVQDNVCITVGCNQRPVVDLQSNQSAFWNPKETAFQEVLVDGRRYGDRDVDRVQDKDQATGAVLGMKDHPLQVTWNVEPVLSTLDSTAGCAKDLFGVPNKNPSCLCTKEEEAAGAKSCIGQKHLTRDAIFKYDGGANPFYMTNSPFRRMLPPTLGLYKVTMDVSDACSTSRDETYIQARCPSLMAQVLPSTVTYTYTPIPTDIRKNQPGGPGIVLDGTKSLYKRSGQNLMQFSWRLVEAPRYSKFCNANYDAKKCTDTPQGKKFCDMNYMGQLFKSDPATGLGNTNINYFYPHTGGTYKFQFTLSDGCSKNSTMLDINYECVSAGLNVVEASGPLTRVAPVGQPAPVVKYNPGNTQFRDFGYAPVEFQITRLSYPSDGKATTFKIEVYYTVEEEAGAECGLCDSKCVPGNTAPKRHYIFSDQLYEPITPCIATSCVHPQCMMGDTKSCIPEVPRFERYKLKTFTNTGPTPDWNKDGVLTKPISIYFQPLVEGRHSFFIDTTDGCKITTSTNLQDLQTQCDTPNPIITTRAPVVNWLNKANTFGNQAAVTVQASQTTVPANMKVKYCYSVNQTVQANATKASKLSNPPPICQDTGNWVFNALSEGTISIDFYTYLVETTEQALEPRVRTWSHSTAKDITVPGATTTKVAYYVQGQPSAAETYPSYDTRLGLKKCKEKSVNLNLEFKCQVLGGFKKPSTPFRADKYVSWNTDLSRQKLYGKDGYMGTNVEYEANGNIKYDVNGFEIVTLRPTDVVTDALFAAITARGDDLSVLKYSWALVGAPGLWYDRNNKFNEVTESMINLRATDAPNGVWQFQPHSMFPGRYHLVLQLDDGCTITEFEIKVEALCNRITINVDPPTRQSNIIVVGPGLRVGTTYFDGLRFKKIELGAPEDMLYWQRITTGNNAGGWKKVDVGRVPYLNATANEPNPNPQSVQNTGDWHETNILSYTWTVANAPIESFYIARKWLGKPFGRANTDPKNQWIQESPIPCAGSCLIDKYRNNVIDSKTKLGQEKIRTQDVDLSSTLGYVEKTQWEHQRVLRKIGSQDIRTTLRNHQQANVAKTCFVPDVDGEYKIELEVNDGCARKPTWRCDPGADGDAPPNTIYNASNCKYNPDSSIYEAGAPSRMDETWAVTHVGQYVMTAKCFLERQHLTFTNPSQTTATTNDGVIPGTTIYARNVSLLGNGTRIMLDMAATTKTFLDSTFQTGGTSFSITQEVPDYRADLQFRWEIESGPESSVFKKGTANKYLTNPDGSIASFIPDKPGTYVFRAEVYDGCATVYKLLVVTINCRNTDLFSVRANASSPLLVYDHDVKVDQKRTRTRVFTDIVTLADFSRLFPTVTDQATGQIDQKCKVDAWKWELEKFDCTPSMPLPAPPTPAPVANLCTAKHKCAWRIIRKPCKSVASEDTHITRVIGDPGTDDADDYFGPARFHKKIRFRPDVAGTYELAFRCEDGCTWAEDTVRISAKCQTSIVVGDLAQDTRLNCAADAQGVPSFGLWSKVCLGGQLLANGTCVQGRSPIATVGPSVQEQPLCPVTRLSLPPTTRKTVTPPKRCCPKCPHCPICPACPKVVCPRCPNCPPFAVCQTVNGVDNCTAAARPLSHSGSSSSGDETTPSRGSPSSGDSAPVPSASGASSSATSAGTSQGTAPSPVSASGGAPQPQLLSGLKQGGGAVSAKTRASTTTLEARIPLSEAQVDSEISREQFVEETESTLANVLQLPVSRVHVDFEAADRTLVVHIDDGSDAGHVTALLTEAFKHGALDFGDHGTATGLSIGTSSSEPRPIDVSDSVDEEYDEDLDSRERMLWLAAVVPVSILVVLSIAANVVLITHYSRMLKGARFTIRSPSSQANTQLYRATPMPAL